MPLFRPQFRIGTIIHFFTRVFSSSEFGPGFELMQGENSHDLFMLFILFSIWFGYFLCDLLYAAYSTSMAMLAFHLFLHIRQYFVRRTRLLEAAILDFDDDDVTRSVPKWRSCRLPVGLSTLGKNCELSDFWFFCKYYLGTTPEKKSQGIRIGGNFWRAFEFGWPTPTSENGGK